MGVASPFEGTETGRTTSTTVPLVEVPFLNVSRKCDSARFKNARELPLILVGFCIFLDYGHLKFPGEGIFLPSFSPRRCVMSSIARRFFFVADEIIIGEDDVNGYHILVVV